MDDCEKRRFDEVDAMSYLRHDTSKRKKNNQGFGLIEAMIATVILVVGLTALAGLFAQSLTFLQSTREDLIAKQKALAALEDGRHLTKTIEDGVRVGRIRRETTLRWDSPQSKISQPEEYSTTDFSLFMLPARTGS